MLNHVPLLAFLIFGVTYPAFLLLTIKDPIKHNFHRFHLACPVIVAGLAIFSLCSGPIDLSLKILAIAWLIMSLAITAVVWNKERGGGVVSILSIVLSGLYLFTLVCINTISSSPAEIFILILSGFIVSSIFYAMNLGHFYLNVLGLKISHLKNAVIVFTCLLGARLLWDGYSIVTASITYNGEASSLLGFMNSMDGFLLWVAFLFGTLFPLGGVYFAFGTLKLKNTQATTGILYVLLSAVLLGDLAFKYYLISFKIPM